MNFNFNRILVLAPHTDDGELGCGGAIANFCLNGADVYYVAFSSCEKSVLNNFPSNILISEVKEATSVLGIKSINLQILDYDVRTFNYNRQSILDDLILLKKSINPDLVFIPSLNDIHQDHLTIANEAIRAFKYSTILSYELPWNNLNFNNTCFIELSEEMVSKKVLSISKYKSQAHRPYANDNFIISLARVRGVQMNKSYAEAFEVVRLIL